MRYTFHLSLLLPLVAASLLSCKRTGPAPERTDYIRVYSTADSDIPLDRVWASVKGGTTTYYIRSNVDFSAQWQSEDMSWARIASPQKLGEGLWSIDVTIQPVRERSYAHAEGAPATGLYTKRYGVLMLTCPSQNLGKYLVIEQGLESRIACNFSWLYGSEDPNATYDEVPMSRWTTAQQNQGFSSTLIDGETDAWVFSKEGYVKLGNDHGAGADLITPRTSNFQFDTLLVVSFKAVVQNGDVLPDFTGGTEPIVPMSRIARLSEEGTVADNNTLTIEVTGGGCIRDLVQTGGTSLSLELPTYDRESALFPSDMFSRGSFLVFIEGTESNPITVNTAIRFIAGSMKGSDEGSCNRVFLDDIFVYRQDLLLDEDLFILNGKKSGKDIICGGTADD